ncbi:Putative oxidoreductase YncB [hydrothermal vent metagenome]|uniref:Oxidoreductase YncB n=1 Tax=hydrothermal vent metagenome TaxID=652676 RepID=A0A3B0R2Y3_9ZZZZ
MTIKSREIRLASRPNGLPKPTDFELAETTLPEPGAGEVLVQNTWMSVDPYMRGRMIDRKSYVPPFQIGQPLEGHAVGKILASNNDNFTKGDLVLSMLGWREAFISNGEGLQKLDTFGLPPQAFLGVAGMPGLTAWGGLLEIGKPKSGETVFVSGAAGAVGSLVCQIAKIKGCRVVGSAGSQAKCDWLKSIGVDEVINYKEHPSQAELMAALKAAAPDGVDVYFENVGGDHLVAALEAMNMNGRIVVCGLISGYNDTEPQPGPWNLFNVIGKSLRIEGFVVTKFMDKTPAFIKDLGEWFAAGKIQSRETVEHGIENAPTAFLKLFSGGNEGKMLVKLGDE